MSDSLFPGMNPYLEHPDHWRGFHNLLAAETLAQVNGQIYPAYLAELEVHTVMENILVSGRSGAYPDVAIYETEQEADFVNPSETAVTPSPLRLPVLTASEYKSRTINIYLSETRELVTAIEILSPANKTGDGLNQYRTKRDKILYSAVHLVEIDFLRGGTRPGLELDTSPPIDTDYIVLVNRSSEARFSDIWPIGLNNRLPTIPIPLLYPDPDATLNLANVVTTIYQRYRYDVIPDYTQPIPAPKLRPAIAKWWEMQQG